MKKQAPAQPPGWLELFDPHYLDQVCVGVGRTCAEATEGLPSSIHEPLRRLIVKQIDEYISVHARPFTLLSHVEAAERFRDLASDLAEDFARGSVFTAADADSRVFALRYAWLEFIAYGAGYLMYWKRAQDWKNSINAARVPMRSRARKLTAEVLAQRLKESRAEELTRTLAQDIASEFKVSVSTVYRRRNAALERGLLP